MAGCPPPSGRGDPLPSPCYAPEDKAGIATVYSGMAYREVVELQDREKKQKILNERYYRRVDENPAKEHVKVVESLKMKTDKLLAETVDTAWNQSTIRRLDAGSASKDAP